MPPPPLPPLEAGIASTGEEANVHNNRYEHKHNVNTVNFSGKEKPSVEKEMCALQRKMDNEELRQKFKFIPSFHIII
jgi:hypothetical protein